MLRIVETADVLEVQAPMPQSRRVLFLVLSLVPLLAPYELIVRPNWDNYSNPHFLFAALVSGGAVAVSAFFALAALAGLSSRMRFDRVGQTFSCSASAPVVPKRRHEYPIVSIDALAVETHDWSDGSPTYSFEVVMTTGPRLNIGSSWYRAEIEEVKKRVASFLGLALRLGTRVGSLTTR